MTVKILISLIVEGVDLPFGERNFPSVFNESNRHRRRRRHLAQHKPNKHKVRLAYSSCRALIENVNELPCLIV